MTDSCGFFEAQSYVGITAGLGQAWVFGGNRNHSIDLDFIARVFSLDIDSDRRRALAAGADVEDVAHQVSLAFGYRYLF